MRSAGMAMIGCLLVLAGCSTGSEIPIADPGPTASAADVNRARNGGGSPIFWLGRSHANERLTSLELGSRPSAVRYGEPLCDESGCQWSATIFTGGQRDVPYTSSRRSVADCWHRIGDAVAFACSDRATEPEVALWTGPVQVSASGFEVAPSAIRPMNRTARELGFTRPRRLTCAQVARMSEDPSARPALRTLPRVLAPRGCPAP